ncbi:hypothetical protein HN51_037113 [Arachis hypogaea]|uniref:Uncharacterized protein n=1 Tax=Arachis hypogaea TaxID=3818 RepID=A0A444ZX52_ARAHY|nr:uncharacterized protein LOC107634646 [Arachis ipaensis]XP_025638063.1 uncharacterized protein LOC112733349 [Arachis hypogaea]QHO02632.1 uncharacterized protein DS421_13g425440 [Arachis hypogaea]RYR18758.1 hypothetical protein Ahy_B03g063363 [Arachis hypogaea]
MSRRGSWITLRSVVDALRSRRFQSSYDGLQRSNAIVSPARVQSSYWMSPALQFFSTNTNSKTSTNLSNGSTDVKVEPRVPSIFLSFPHWLRWLLGSVLGLLLPFWKIYWGKLERIEGEAEIVAEEVEAVASVVEKVATVAEKVSEDVAEMLPEDANLKKVAVFVEHASEQIAHDAQLAQQFIHKVEKVKNDLDDLESFVEPVIDKIVKKEAEQN